VATDLIALEKRILDKISPIAAGFGIRVGLLDAQELKTPVSSGQAFLSYGGRRLVQEVSTFNGGSVYEYSFELIYRHLNLRTHNEAYPLLSAVVSALKGFEVSEYNVKPMRLESEKPDLSQIADGLWMYIQTYKFELLEI
jgi:hypothetical protein